MINKKQLALRYKRGASCFNFYFVLHVSFRLLETTENNEFCYKRGREKPVGELPNEKLQELISVVFHLHNLSDSVNSYKKQLNYRGVLFCIIGFENGEVSTEKILVK